LVIFVKGFAKDERVVRLLIALTIGLGNGKILFANFYPLAT
jgi:hypothetical protein